MTLLQVAKSWMILLIRYVIQEAMHSVILVTCCFVSSLLDQLELSEVMGSMFADFEALKEVGSYRL